MLATPLNDQVNRLPSPESLKNKILLKGAVNHTDAVEALGDKKPIVAEKVNKKLSDLIYLKTTSYKGPDKGEAYEMSSFDEDKIAKLKRDEVIYYNHKQLSRVFPKGVRFNSENYDAFPAFSTGCQLVALNYQTYDKHLRANVAKFIDNGRCGYMLKPPRLLPADAQKVWAEDPNFVNSVSVTVHSARFLPKPAQMKDDDSAKGKKKKSGFGFIKVIMDHSDAGLADPEISVMVIGEKEDNAKDTTRTIPDNGLTPTWKQPLKKFKITASYNAVMLFTVYSKQAMGHERLAQCGIPVNCIRAGYRVLQLYHPTTNKPISMCTLLCQFAINK
jgi:hypothetical protein